MLSALIWVPIVAAAIVGFWPGNLTAKTTKQFSLIVTAIVLILSLALVSQFNVLDSNQQFVESLPWIDALGLTYQLGVDGLSLPLVIINSLLTLVALYATQDDIRRPRFYYSLVLVLNGAVTGAFVAQDLLLFFLFYELEIIPLYFLIAIWGGVRRGYAATKFLIYTALSGILILASFLGLVWLTHSPTFAYGSLRPIGETFAGIASGSFPTSALPITTQLVLTIGILIGFGIKIPLVPFHTWLPDAHVEASTPISVLLAGVLLKLGTYGLMRFGLGLFPEAWAILAPWLASWAVFSVLYGALNAIAQTDMKKMVAYSSIGHMGYILLATAAATPLSLLATVFQMVSHGLISALLFILVGVVYHKTGTRDIQVLRGLLNPERGLPVIGSLMIVAVMASAGLPGMIGFIAEFLIFRGSYPVFPTQTILCMVGTGLTAVYFLLLVNKAFFGRLSEEFSNLPPVSWSDRAPAIVLAAIIVFLGLQPNWMVRWSDATTASLIILPQIHATKTSPSAKPLQAPQLSQIGG
ncbi:NADH-quinone oxidoreductase subunit M [Merismopedia glauca]|uniref:NAD(P)H-quinone oxidoreductase subunit D4 n=1 Tax=Merismopedia glauca CCAP 1448/3 TaxID=1296344 RepID=A0A2T1C6R9_9CYAN|nr:NADH-quinone oxidoreductase subunit M [Merismopedia glauca]PSB03970.1 NAD(P)H-quinone oxidoreductase subunit D4 [Merismopedia glauca CCAP 1448/3]